MMLLLMLLGLLRWRFESGGGSGLGSFLWTQVGLPKAFC